MTYFNLQNAKIKAVAASVPDDVEYTTDYKHLYGEEHVRKFIISTGVQRRFTLDTDMPALVDLRNAFMSTLRRLETAAREIETMKTREVKAQMLALQNQMNSHFVHNTLAVIASVGCENDGERLSNMCRSLSGMLQYTSTLSPDGYRHSQQ